MTELLHSHTPYPLLLLFTFRRSLQGGVGQAWAWTYIIFSLFQTQKFTHPLGARKVFRPDWGGELEGEKEKKQRALEEFFDRTISKSDFQFMNERCDRKITQIQEQTLGFAVKLIAISLTLLVCASWIGSTLLLYTQDIFTHFALLR